MFKVVRNRSIPLLWALVLLHDVLGVGPFLPRTTPKAHIHTWGLKLIDFLSGSHWWVATLHLFIANLMLLYIARPKYIHVARWAIGASVAFFTGLSIAFLLLIIDNTVYVVTSAFCFSLTIISWRAFLDTKVAVTAEEILRAAAFKLTEQDHNGNSNGHH